MPGQSTSLSACGDIEPVLEKAIELGGLRFCLPRHSAAVRWRHRAYAFRKLLRSEPADRTPFDRITISLQPVANSSECSVDITVNELSALHSATDLLGNPINFTTAEVIEEELL